MSQKIIMRSEIAKYIDLFEVQHLLGGFCPSILPSTPSTLYAKNKKIKKISGLKYFRVVAHLRQ